MKRFFTYDRFVRQEFDILLDHLRQKKCSFLSCLESGRSPTARGISFRYDIHARDIEGAYGFLAAHYRHGVPGTFFLLADYSNHEHARRDEFQRLAERIKAPLDVGLHDSPVDAYLINHRFSGSGVDYWRWLQSDEALRWFGTIADSADLQARFDAEVMAYFELRVSRMKDRFGPFRSMASHGGELNQRFRARVGELGKTGEFLSSLFSESWINSDRLAHVDLDADVEQFRSKAPRLYQVSDGGGQIERMLRNVDKFTDRNAAVQMLLHPYTWGGPSAPTGGKRDGELSILLGNKKGGNSMSSGRQWWQRLLRTRLASTAERLPATREVPKTATVPTSAAPVAAELPATIVSAKQGQIDWDIKHAPGNKDFGEALILEAETGLLARPAKPAVTLLFDYLASLDTERRSGSVVIGRSISKYGALVAGAVKSLTKSEVGGPDPLSFPQHGLARWLQNYFRTESGTQPGASRLDRKELTYFLTSTSYRAEVVVRILNHFLQDRHIACLVDHGAGIGMMALCANFARSGGIRQVACSEVRKTFVAAGVELWESAGYKDTISYQQCSAVDFQYPKEASVVMFGQMLLRIPPVDRARLLQSAWDSLDTGGLLVINELMDREQTTTTNPLLTSSELLSYLPATSERWVFWGGADPMGLAKLDGADRALLRRSDNFIALRK